MGIYICMCAVLLVIALEYCTVLIKLNRFSLQFSANALNSQSVCIFWYQRHHENSFPNLLVVVCLFRSASAVDVKPKTFFANIFWTSAQETIVYHFVTLPVPILSTDTAVTFSVIKKKMSRSSFSFCCFTNTFYGDWLIFFLRNRSVYDNVAYQMKWSTDKC